VRFFETVSDGSRREEGGGGRVRGEIREGEEVR
jgi:hypothetical protein